MNVERQKGVGKRSVNSKILEEMQKRLKRGEENLGHLLELIPKMAPGRGKDEAEAKALRMIVKLDELKEEFIKRYPDNCLHWVGRECQEKNKGAFPCYDCMRKEGVLLVL